MRDWYPVAKGGAEWDKAPNNLYKNSEENSQSKGFQEKQTEFQPTAATLKSQKSCYFNTTDDLFPITWPTARVNQVLNNGPLQPAAFTVRSYRKTAPSNMEESGGAGEAREQNQLITPLPDATLKSLQCLIMQHVATKTRNRREEKRRQVDLLPGAWSSWSSGKRSSRVSLLESESFSSWQDDQEN